MGTGQSEQMVPGFLPLMTKIDVLAKDTEGMSMES